MSHPLLLFRHLCYSEAFSSFSHLCLCCLFNGWHSFCLYFRCTHWQCFSYLYFPSVSLWKSLALASQENMKLWSFPSVIDVCFTVTKGTISLLFLCIVLFHFSQNLVPSFEDVLNSRRIQPVRYHQCRELGNSDDAWMTVTRFTQASEWSVNYSFYLCVLQNMLLASRVYPDSWDVTISKIRLLSYFYFSSYISSHLWWIDSWFSTCNIPWTESMWCWVWMAHLRIVVRIKGQLERKR